MTPPKNQNSFGKIVCVAIGALIGIAILKGIGSAAQLAGGLGALLGALVGGFVYSSLIDLQ